MCCIVEFDAFYKGLSEEQHEHAADYNFDSPNALDFDLAYEKILQLLKYQDVEIPIYDFVTHKRNENEHRQLAAQPILIFEGIFALYEKRFRDLMDLTIFVLTDDDLRLARRIKRDMAERGRMIQDILAQYNRFVKSSYDEFTKPTMKYADIIVPRGKENVKGIEFVINNLKLSIPQDDLEAQSQQAINANISSNDKDKDLLVKWNGLEAVIELGADTATPPSGGTVEAQLKMEKSYMRPAQEKKMEAIMNKLLIKQELKDDDDLCLSDMYVENLFALLFPEVVTIEKMMELYKKNADCRIQNIENIQFAFSQQATYFAPELISQKSIDEIIHKT